MGQTFVCQNVPGASSILRTVVVAGAPSRPRSARIDGFKHGSALVGGIDHRDYHASWASASRVQISGKYRSGNHRWLDPCHSSTVRLLDSSSLNKRRPLCAGRALSGGAAK